MPDSAPLQIVIVIAALLVTAVIAAAVLRWGVREPSTLESGSSSETPPADAQR